MTTSNDDPTQERIIFNDEERHVVLRSILNAADETARREAFAELLLDLRQHLGEDGNGWQKVHLELHRLIEWLFKGSETYALALELYERRFALPGGHPAEVLRLILDEQFSPAPRNPSGTPMLLSVQSASRFSPEQYRKRLEVAGAAILGTEAERVDGMHGCLSADEATLRRILTLLEES